MTIDRDIQPILHELPFYPKTLFALYLCRACSAEQLTSPMNNTSITPPSSSNPSTQGLRLSHAAYA